MNVLIVGLSENSSMRGVERYTYELVKSLSKQGPVSICLLCGTWQEYYKSLEQDNVKIQTIHVQNSKIIRHLWHYFVMPLRFKKYDVVHVVNTNPILFRLGKKVIVTIHDLAEYFVPEKYGLLQRFYRRWVSWLVSRVSSHILTDSDYSKRSIVNKLKVPDTKVTSIHLGVDHFRGEHKEALSKEALSSELNLDSKKIDRYFLYWGVVERSKGVVETIQAFQQLLHENAQLSGLNLIICGKMGNAVDDIKESIDSDNCISFLGHVSDSVLQSLCVSASAILFPSRYEGFGFPAIEGFIYNDNVIASKTTSLGEITRDFAWQVDPGSIEEIKMAMLSTLQQPRRFTERQKAEVLNRFTWTECAEKTYGVYRNVADIH